jgi:hypothetical protein
VSNQQVHQEKLLRRPPWGSAERDARSRSGGAHHQTPARNGAEKKERRASLSEACFYVADADDPAQAREEVGRLVVRILEGLKTRSEIRVAGGTIGA